jgi:hypothetical protein
MQDITSMGRADAPAYPTNLPKPNPSCALTVYKWATLFFFLSVAALGTLYGLNTTQYVLIPYITGGLSLTVFIIARCKMLIEMPASQSKKEI